MEFIDHLEHCSLLSSIDAKRVRTASEENRLSAIETLLQLGLVDDRKLAEEQSRFIAVPMANATGFPDTLPPVDDLNLHWLERKNVLPLEIGEDSAEVAAGDWTDDSLERALTFALGRPIVKLIAPISDIQDHWARVMPNIADDDDGLSQSDVDRFTDMGTDAPVVRLVDRLLSAAARQGASDVHIEPGDQHVLVRFRIDGRLREMERHPASLAEPIASRIKVMAALDIAESRLPQDGRLRITAGGRDVDVRVSTSPITHGESIVLRLLGQSRVSLDLSSLGIRPLALDQLKQALARPHGIILVTGPTGSGKTTTLYSALNHLRRPDVKILSVEDPVEITLDGVNQVQVQPEINLDYARTLRAFLRQDPDILMVGEIRDKDTAEISLRAALTGHLVLSTLHTNSALGAFTRLNDIGIEPFLAASTVIATAAQRLVRTICNDCAEPLVPAEADKALFAQYGIGDVKRHLLAMGCPSCSYSGFSGRMPLFEIIPVSEELRELVRLEQSDNYRVDPSDTLLGHGLTLVANGKTSLDEVMRVVQAQ